MSQKSVFDLFIPFCIPIVRCDVCADNAML